MGMHLVRVQHQTIPLCKNHKHPRMAQTVPSQQARLLHDLPDLTLPTCPDLHYLLPLWYHSKSPLTPVSSSLRTPPLFSFSLSLSRSLSFCSVLSAQHCTSQHCILAAFASAKWIEHLNANRCTARASPPPGTANHDNSSTTVPTLYHPLDEAVATLHPINAESCARHAVCGTTVVSALSGRSNSAESGPRLCHVW